MTAALVDDPVLGLADALVGRWAATQRPVVEKATARALARWGALDVYSGDEVYRFGQDMAALSTAVQGASRNLTFGYLQSVLRVLGSPVGQGILVAAGVAAAGIAVRKGVELARAYERPAETVRYLQSTGVAYDLARTQGARRLATMLDTDAQLASRDAAHELIGRLGGGGGGGGRDGRNITGYRRIVRPELSRGLPCGLCVVAADQIYGTDELLPLHNGCHCTVMPIVIRNGKTYDPGQTLNDEDLATLYEQAGGTDRAGLQRVRVEVRQHGELGPTLVDANQHWKGKPRTQRREDAPADRQREVEAQIATAEKVIADLQRRAAAGEDVSRPMAYQTEQLARLRVEDTRPFVELPEPEPERDPADLSDAELDEAMAAALEAEDFDRFDALGAEADRRDTERQEREAREATNAAARERRAERAAEKEERQAQHLEELLGAGVDEESAVEEAYGISIEAQRRDRAVISLRDQGYEGRSFVELARASFRDYVYQQYMDAEDATNGFLLNRAGEAAGIDPHSLFTGPEARARKYASDELKAWWDTHGRPTFEQWEAELLGDNQAANRSRAAGSEFLQ